MNILCFFGLLLVLLCNNKSFSDEQFSDELFEYALNVAQSRSESLLEDIDIIRNSKHSYIPYKYDDRFHVWSLYPFIPREIYNKIRLKCPNIDVEFIKSSPINGVYLFIFLSSKKLYLMEFKRKNNSQFTSDVEYFFKEKHYDVSDEMSLNLVTMFRLLKEMNNSKISVSQGNLRLIEMMMGTYAFDQPDDVFFYGVNGKLFGATFNELLIEKYSLAWRILLFFKSCVGFDEFDKINGEGLSKFIVDKYR